jgi:hypothetical protein
LANAPDHCKGAHGHGDQRVVMEMLDSVLAQAGSR